MKTVKLPFDISKSKGFFIFDVDGTCTIVGDRVKHLQGEEKDWDAFYDAAVEDLPNYPVLRVMDSLIAQGYDIVLLTGRPDRIRWSTIEYISRHSTFVEQFGSSHMFQADKLDLAQQALFMPATRDWTPDYKFKRNWLHSLPEEARSKLQGVFEDRDRVCQMWREENVVCFQVQEGKY